MDAATPTDAPETRTAPAMFAVAFAIATLVHLVGSGQIHVQSTLDLMLVATAVVTLVLGARSGIALQFLSLALVVDYALQSPIGSNHHLFLTMIASTVLLGGGVALFRGKGLSLEATYDVFAAPARWLIVPLYFFGTFHKINWDYLDPTVSCGPALWDRIVDPIGLDGILWMQHSAIWGTYVVEIVAMLLLLHPRWKLWGMIIGVPFHVLIGFASYAFYMDFSTATMALYALFLPEAVGQHLVAAVKERLPRQAPWPVFAAILLWVAWVLWIAGGVLTSDHLGLYGQIWGPSHYAVYGPEFVGGVAPDWLVRKALLFPTFTIYVTFAMVLLLVAEFVWKVRADGYGLRPSAPLLLVVPIAYWVNCMAPYLGLHTEHALAMFSNVVTEGGRSNHVFFSEPPYVFGYQEHLATDLDSNLPVIANVPDDRGVILFEINRRLQLAGPEAWATFTVDGTRYDTRTMDQATKDAFGIGPYSALAGKVLRFRTVDLTAPIECRH